MFKKMLKKLKTCQMDNVELYEKTVSLCQCGTPLGKTTSFCYAFHDPQCHCCFGAILSYHIVSLISPTHIAHRIMIFIQYSINNPKGNLTRFRTEDCMHEQHIYAKGNRVSARMIKQFQILTSNKNGISGNVPMSV